MYLRDGFSIDSGFDLEGLAHHNIVSLHRTARDVDNALGEMQFRGESPETLMIFSFALRMRVRLTKSMKVS